MISCCILHCFGGWLPLFDIILYLFWGHFGGDWVNWILSCLTIVQVRCIATSNTAAAIGILCWCPDTRFIVHKRGHTGQGYLMVLQLSSFMWYPHGVYEYNIYKGLQCWLTIKANLPHWGLVTITPDPFALMQAHPLPLGPMQAYSNAICNTIMCIMVMQWHATLILMRFLDVFGSAGESVAHNWAFDEHEGTGTLGSYNLHYGHNAQ